MELGFVTVFIIFAVITAMAASARNRSGFGWFVLGLFLGPLALIMVLVLQTLPPDPRKIPKEQRRIPCPRCGEEIMGAALVCRHCKSEFQEPVYKVVESKR